MKKQTALLFGIPLLLLVLCDFSSVSICDGSYQLIVEIEPKIAADESQIYYIGYHGSELGDKLQANIDNELSFMNQPEDIADSFQVGVRTTIHRSPLGRTWGYVQQFSEMIVVLLHEDGTRSVYRLEIPQRDISRRVVLSAENLVSEKAGSVISNQ